MKKKLGVIIMMMLLLGGCSIDIGTIDTEMQYSREDTKFMQESILFGTGRSDDIYVALNYLYSNEEIKEKHGSDFEITFDDVVCYFSEGKSYFFVGLYKGEAKYFFTIDDTTYIVELSKSIFGVWTVKECRSK